MKQLKMFLTLLFISLFCFIPKTFASETTNVTMFATSHSIIEPYSQISEYNNTSYIQLGDSQFIKFKVLQFNDIHISKVCEGQKYYYRFDYQIWGWHNETKSTRDWVNFAKSLFTFPNLNVLGSIIDIPNGYTLNISTFIEWTLPSSSECTTENLDFFQLNFSDKLSDLYFYNSNHTNSSIYAIYNSTYEITSPTYAQQLIESYYETGDINTEKLDEISGKLVDVNNKLEETNQKLDSIYNTVTDTSSPDLGGLSNANTWLPQGPVDSIIMLPLNFINTLINKIGSTCSPINLPLPFLENKYLTLPCISTLFEQINGFSTLYNLIGVIGSVYLLYNYLLKFYKWIDDTLSFRENNWQDWGGD